MDKETFQEIILTHYKNSGRTFPWRKNINPWGVLVSEFMLQQTQTERVVDYWKRWMKKWPSAKDLAKADLEEVLREWSGLGYNRRARFLKQAAEKIVSDFNGEVPQTPTQLKTLPGIGEYSSGAIACFAYNVPCVFIETNIRRVILHFFFQDKTDVKDSELFPIIEQTLHKGNPRVWYWALMDYGSELKKVTINPNRRSAHYTKQSKFEGSLRQVRGAIIKTLANEGPAKIDELHEKTGFEYDRLNKALEKLHHESMVAEIDGVYKIK
ncbi:MAG: A/G-specific adenine glycosylase [Treponema sp.]|jgi:A/G-specific adenine glycosylase|nr:A/G-specific adenine glycosylase [Treponema sp.]